MNKFPKNKRRKYKDRQRTKYIFEDAALERTNSHVRTKGKENSFSTIHQ